MKKQSDVLCEVIFRDHKSGIITSRIGKINKSQLTYLFTTSKNFIKFNESYNSPILKTDVQRIIIHHDDSKLPIEKEDSIIIKYLNSQKTGEIS
jgi:tetraacyldisaccharide-1-P 4'-kinase